MNKSYLYAALVLGGLQFLAGCQTVPYQGEARDVKRRPHEGGIVAIQRKYKPEDRLKAEETMTAVCAPNAFKIIEEGEVATGQEIVSNTRNTHRENSEHQVGSLFGMPLVSGDKGGTDAATSSTTRNTTEWQISYACEKSSAAASSQPVTTTTTSAAPSTNTAPAKKTVRKSKSSGNAQ